MKVMRIHKGYIRKMILKISSEMKRVYFRSCIGQFVCKSERRNK